MILFKEILPNPSGKDVDGEWIKITNTSNKEISLEGWSIYEVNGKRFLFSTLKKDNQIIYPKEDLILPYSVTKIMLNNNGDEIRLLNKKGEIEDILSYSKSISEEEIVFGKTFEPKNISNQASLVGVEKYTTKENYIFNNKINLSPILIGIVIAFVFSFIISILTRKFIEER